MTDSNRRPKRPCTACRSDENRCVCGSLLARYVPGGVELKCRRCKRTTVLPVEAPRHPER